MKKLTLIALFVLILLLGGCESAYDIDDIYYNKALLEGVELDKIVLDYEQIILDDTILDTDAQSYILYKELIVMVEIQYSYKDDHIFRPVIKHWHCIEGDCNIVTEDEYNNLGGK